MSHGKAAARDIRYGRRGGRWSDGDRADAALAAIAHARNKGLADRTWPDGSPAGDRKCGECGQPIGQHSPPCGFCGRSPEHHAAGDIDIEIAGRARMALARQVAGQPLDQIDRRALGANRDTEAVRLIDPKETE